MPPASTGSLAWIPVSRRLPQTHTPVVVYCCGEIRVCCRVDDEWYLAGCREWETFEPTHWMPLPEPPEVTP